MRRMIYAFWIAVCVAMTVLPAPAQETMAGAISADPGSQRAPDAGSSPVKTRAETLNAGAVKTEPQKTEQLKPDAPVSESDYIIGHGDQLEISIWKEDALTKLVFVLPDGKIHFPLIGEVQAAGKTVRQLKQEITKKISGYVPDPSLSIDVRQVGSMVIYVIGKVNSPGRFAMTGNISVLQALSTAGGLNPFAKRNRIKIFRQEGDKTTIIEFHYDDVIDGKKLEENIILKRGDVIVVP